MCDLKLDNAVLLSHWKFCCRRPHGNLWTLPLGNIHFELNSIDRRPMLQLATLNSVALCLHFEISAVRDINLPSFAVCHPVICHGNLWTLPLGSIHFKLNSIDRRRLIHQLATLNSVAPFLHFEISILGGINLTSPAVSNQMCCC